MPMPAFSEDDIRTLVCHPARAKRAGAAQRICENYASAKLSPADRAVADKLLRAMAEDACQLVRAALVVTLHNSPELPRDVAVRLARDVDSIAVPLIKFSPVLTDNDLVTVLRSRAAAKIRAAAERARVSVELSRTIIRWGDGPAVARLASNDGAELDESTAREMVRLWHDDDLVAEAMVRRSDMPLDILETLVAHTSAETVLAMTARGAGPHMAVDVANRARERATLRVSEAARRANDMDELIDGLERLGRLTPSLVLRSLCQANMDFAEAALARMAGLSRSKVRLMLHTTDRANGGFAFRQLVRRAGLPSLHADVLAMATSLYGDLERAGVPDRRAFASGMVERLATSGIALSEEDTGYLLECLAAA